jgi:ParB-like chromosome segregation protein Spo0J
MKLNIADIQIPSTRARKDMGDIAALAASIESVGLLQPVVVDKNHRLIAGHRRIKALQTLNCDEVEVRVVAGLDDAVQALTAERDENTCREAFKPSEATSLGERLEALERERAKERREATQAKPGHRIGDDILSAPIGKGSTRDIVGKAVGMSGMSYTRAKAVVNAAKKEPEKFGALVEEMDRTGKVSTAYNKLPAKYQQQPKVKKATKPPPAPVPPSERPSAVLRKLKKISDAITRVSKEISTLKDGPRRAQMLDALTPLKREVETYRSSLRS